MKLFNITKLTARTAMIAKSTQWGKVGVYVSIARKMPGRKVVETVAPTAVGLRDALLTVLELTESPTFFETKHPDITTGVYSKLGFRPPHPDSSNDAYRIFVRTDGTLKQTSIMLLESYSLDIDAFRGNVSTLIEKLNFFLAVIINDDNTADLSGIPDTSLEMDTLTPVHDWTVIPVFRHFEQTYTHEIIAVDYQFRKDLYRSVNISTVKKSEHLFFLEKDVNTSVDFILSQLDTIPERSIRKVEIEGDSSLYVTRGRGQEKQNPLNIVSVGVGSSWIVNWRDSDKHLEFMRMILGKMKI